MVPHIMAPPGASVSGLCHCGEQVVWDAPYAFEGTGNGDSDGW